MRRTAVVTMLVFLTSSWPGPAMSVEAQCSGTEVKGLVRTFADAYNRGDVEYLEQIWAEEDRFFWYFVDTDLLRRGPLAKNRTTLSPYFRERSLYADQLRIHKLSVRWQRGWHGAWGISFTLHRKSDQSGASGVYHGKGAATCGPEGGFLHAWAMGRET